MATLNETQTKEIDKEATQLLESVFGGIDNLKLPVNLNAVLDYCSLVLKEGDFSDKDIAAALDRSSKTIFVSAADKIERKSFSIAHEIGHFKLHKDIETDLFYRSQAAHLLGPEENQIETAANWFAASLLMPEKLVKEFWTIVKDVEKMSKIFGVSQSAMRYRLKYLKLTK